MRTIGIIGGGQLGLMIAEQARALGVRTVCLDPAADAPAAAVCDDHLVAAFDDAAALETLCRRCDVVTYEFENVPGEILVDLERKYTIPQGFRPLFDAQDRLREKENARTHGLDVPRYRAVDSPGELRLAAEALGFPCVLKTRRMGYDGHGQIVLRSTDDLPRAERLLDVPCILEEFVRFDYEASIVMVRDHERTIHFPVGRNVHRDGILDLSFVPAPMEPALLDRLVHDSEAFMRRCDYRGILAIEYFVCGDRVLFNEMAPRPHNSGHWTIEGCSTNQFRELCRFLLGQPLETPRLIAPTIMKNILGRDYEAARRVAAENLPDVYVHLYGKSECRPLRKMGHITFTGLTAADYDTRWADRFDRETGHRPQ